MKDAGVKLEKFELPKRLTDSPVVVVASSFGHRAPDERGMKAQSFPTPASACARLTLLRRSGPEQQEGKRLRYSTQGLEIGRRVLGNPIAIQEMSKRVAEYFAAMHCNSICVDSFECCSVNGRRSFVHPCEVDREI